MAEEPRLKAVVATQDVTRETVVGVAQDLRRAVGSELFVLTDGAGRLVVDVADPGASGDLASNPVVAAAIQRGEGGGVWIHDQRAYQVKARRLQFGITVVGVLVLGYELDDRVADTVQRQTGDTVVIELGGAAVAASALDGGRRPDRARLGAALAAVSDGSKDPVEVTIDGTRYLAVAAAFPGATAAHPIRYLILRSLDRALEAWRTVSRVLFGIAAAGLLAAVLLAIRLSRRLSRPVDSLVLLTERIAAGDLTARSRVRRPVELATLGESMNRMAHELLESRGRLADNVRLHRELEIAMRIQTSLQPRALRVPGLDVAAAMRPADEVGGDYYDVIPAAGGAWIGIGDVAGHGLTAGLVMMMIQSIIAALVAERPGAAPRELLGVLNGVLYENIRGRLGQDEHVTLTLLRYTAGGTLMYAGAHEEIVVCRAGEARCQRIATPGTWLGAAPDVGRFMVDSKLQLAAGDLVALYTDGLIQAMDASGEQYGMERLCALVEEHRARPVNEIRDQVLDSVKHFSASQEDDITLLVLRYQGMATA
jgi:sigma-B regulation protein RsbU (phosphoserine phosphatase)